MKKTIFTVLLIVVLIVVGLLVASRIGVKEADSPVGADSVSNMMPVLGSDVDEMVVAEDGTISEEDKKLDNAIVQAQSVVVIYTDSGFAPKTIEVKLGGTVIFKNQSSHAMWVASGLHPTHELYPEFDNKKSVQPGGEYRFTFDKLGEWGYHNHEAAQDWGKVIVNQ